MNNLLLAEALDKSIDQMIINHDQILFSFENDSFFSDREIEKLKNTYEQDENQMRCVSALLKQNKIKEAAAVARSLDTAIRDNIPHSVAKAFGWEIY